MVRDAMARDAMARHAMVTRRAARLGEAAAESSGDDSAYDGSQSSAEFDWSYHPPPKARARTPPEKKRGVYVLQTGRKYYVGKSNDIAARIREHRATRRTTKASKQVAPLTQPVLLAGEQPDWESWERNETLTRMYEFGIDNVRGWMFTSAHLNRSDQDAAYRQICEKFDLCPRCGRATHFASECTATHKTQWGERVCDNRLSRK